MVVTRVAGTLRRAGKSMEFVCGSIFNPDGRGFPGPFTIPLDPVLRSVFGWIVGVRRGC
jgi:hypothetical protein